MSGREAALASDVHRSIGEVLALLREEFPDITISKIRFLESQGLVDPERTPSGYRRFFDTDIDRLRWILRQQRENYLPLKVIKDRLDDADGADSAGSDAYDASPKPQTATAPSVDPAAAVAAKDRRSPDSGVAHLLNLTAEPPELEEHIVAPPASPSAAVVPPQIPSANPPGVPAAEPATGAAPVAPPAHPPAAAPPAAAPPTAAPPAAAPATDPQAGGYREPSLFAGRGVPAESVPSQLGAAHADLANDPASSGVGDSREPVAWHGGREALTSVSLTAQELADTAGLRIGDIAELEKFGLIGHTRAGSVDIYDDDALIVARLSAAFRAQGIDFRHLRMFKVAADREAALFEQVVTPLARKRTPEARRELNDTITDLARLTDSLHSVLLHAALRTLG